jgi:ABC-type antimicrobial peptide transport system permease subunit
MINCGNHVINTSAQDLAKSFNKKDMMGSFLLCLCFFAAFVRVFNNKYLLRFKHLNKALVCSLSWAFGFGLFYFALSIEDKSVGFYLSLFCTVIYGVNLAVATVTVIGFMKTFPPDVLVGYSSGSGLAGMTGSGVVMLARRLGIPFSAVAVC